MCKSTICTVKGFLTGVVLGMVGGTVGCCLMHSHRHGIKRHMGRALRNVGELVDSVTGMF